MRICNETDTKKKYKQHYSIDKNVYHEFQDNLLQGRGFSEKFAFIAGCACCGREKTAQECFDKVSPSHETSSMKIKDTKASRTEEI